MINLKKFRKDIIKVAFARSTAGFKELLLLPIIAKGLGAEGYGLWSQSLVTISLIVPISSLGLHFAFTRFFSGEKENKTLSSGFWSTFIISTSVSFLFASFIYFFASNFSSLIFDSSEFENIVFLLSLTIILWNIERLCFNFFRSQSNMGYYSFFFSSKNIFEFLLASYFVISGFGLYYALLSLIIVGLVNNLVMLSIIISKIGFSTPYFNKSHEHLKFSLPLIPNNLSAWAIQFSDRYIIVILIGISSAGIYSASYTISSPIYLMTLILGFVLTPYLSPLWDKKDKESVEQIIGYSIRYFLMLGIPMVFGLAMLSKEILILLADQSFTDYGTTVVPLVALGMIFMGLGQIFSQIIIIEKKTYLLTYISFISAVTNIVLNFNFIPKYGVVGAGYSTVISFFIFLSLNYYYSIKILTFFLPYKFILKCIFCSIGMSFLIHFIKITNTFSVLIIITMSFLVYLILLGLIGEIKYKNLKTAFD